MRQSLYCAVIGVVVALSSGAAVAADEVEIIVAPDAYVIPYDANKRREYVDLVVQTIAARNRSRGVVEILELRLDYLQNGRRRASQTTDPAVMAAQTAEFARMAQAGLGFFLNAQLLSPDGLAGIAGADARLASAPRLQPDDVLLATGRFASLGFEPDEVEVAVRYRARGRVMKALKRIAVRRRAAGVEYSFPLDGAWLMAGAPSIQSHHRWIPSNEFALDFFKLGADGRQFDGDRRDPANAFGYGAPVRAAAAGEVVFVIDDVVQDRAALMRRDGESREDAGRRIEAHLLGRFAEDFRRAAAGNLVVVEHKGANGEVEYSTYGHLKTGSVRVTPGERVAQGQQIGEVGDTGDSPVVHLHFQVNEGPDPFFSRSRPTAFKDMMIASPTADPGVFVSGPERKAP